MSITSKLSCALTGYIAVVSLACSKVEEPAPNGDRSPSGTTERPVQRLIQTSVPSGSTNVDTSPRIQFGVMNVSGDTLRDWAQSVGSTARFISANGETHDVQMSVVDKTAEVLPYSDIVEAYSSQPLMPDTWYTLVVQKQAGWNISDSVGLADAGATEYRTSFFTGSAPRLLRLQRSADSQKPIQSLQVLWSEPMVLSSLVDSAFRISIGGIVEAGCAYKLERCVSEKDTVVSEVVDYLFNNVQEHEPPADMEIHVAATAQGSGRDLESGAAHAGLSTAKVDSTGYSWTINRSDWQPCPGSPGDIVCWKPAD